MQSFTLATVLAAAASPLTSAFTPWYHPPSGFVQSPTSSSTPPSTTSSTTSTTPEFPSTFSSTDPQQQHEPFTMRRHAATLDQTLQKPTDVTVVTATEDAIVTPPVIRLTWEASVEQQIREAMQERMKENEERVRNGEPKKPYMVAVIGIPGSGKSTSTSILAGLLQDVGSLHMPFDGYHHPKDILLTRFADPEDALYRRGAPDTFDSMALYTDLERIRYGNEPQVTIPDFDHAIADPEPDAHVFDRENHNVVLVEGLYLLHDGDGWESIKNFFDLSVFVNADVDVCVERLKERNKCIPGYTPEEIERRCHIVDRANAMTVMRSLSRAHLVVESAAMMSQPQRV